MLFETICFKKGIPQNLSYHQARLNEAQHTHFDQYTPIDLNKELKCSQEGTLRCRIEYGKDLKNITFYNYKSRIVATLKAVESDITYNYKYTDRDLLNDLFANRENADDILIIKNGFVTDTSIANIAFFNGSKWITPKYPLLKGTTRQRLLHTGFISARDITLKEAVSFEGFALMNAMIGFKIIKHGIIV